jgi:outer membrane lipoprotein SlyB
MKYAIAIAAALGLAGCATTDTGEYDCTKAPNARLALEASITSANTAMTIADQLCVDSEDPASKACKNASTVRTISIGIVTASNAALTFINTRCP